MLIVLFLSKITNNLKERTETSTEEGIQVSGEINARYLCVYVHTFFSVALRPNAGHGLLILDVSRSHTTTHHSR